MSTILISTVVSLDRDGDIAVITIDNPPVNAISQGVRAELLETVRQAQADASAKAIVVICAGKTFLSGADLGEFDTGIAEPGYLAVLNALEQCSKPVVAAMHGTALGGGVEISLACHYRVALGSARLGFPEITLGLVPGAGGTQRLPRLIGAKRALDMILTGKPMGAKEAQEAGLIDEVIEGDLRAGALAFTKQLIAAGTAPRRTRDLPVRDAGAEVFDQARATARKTLKGRTTSALDIEAVQYAARLSFDQGVAREEELSKASLEQIESMALRHLFFAERNVKNVPGLKADLTARPVRHVGIIGSGTMGGGIAMCFANAGIPVALVDVEPAALDRGLAAIKKNYDVSVQRGRMTAAEVDERMAKIRGTTDYASLADVDLVIEAVFENMDLKKRIFSRLDAVVKPGAILATNTSTLDIDEIAAVTLRPCDVIGLHFFSPANVMRLLEIVRTKSTADDVIATAFAIARTLGKVGVLARVGYGFIGNRMMDPYGREAERMLLEGATPADIDSALEDYGMAMGILAVFDMAGVDVGVKTRIERAGLLPDDPSFYRSSAMLYEKSWLGQKTAKGFYIYEGRERRPNPEALEMFAAEGRRLRIPHRVPSREEIVERCLYSMVNEGARILEEGVAIRAADIDVVYASGYGFPRHRGGPMFWADSVGLQTVLAGINRYKEQFGPLHWQPAKLLETLAREGKGFKDLDRG